MFISEELCPNEILDASASEYTKEALKNPFFAFLMTSYIFYHNIAQIGDSGTSNQNEISLQIK